MRDLQYLIDTSGTKTKLHQIYVTWLGACRGSSYGAATFAWNIGQDEWILLLQEDYGLNGNLILILDKA